MAGPPCIIHPTVLTWHPHDIYLFGPIKEAYRTVVLQWWLEGSNQKSFLRWVYQLSFRDGISQLKRKETVEDKICVQSGMLYIFHCFLAYDTKQYQVPVLELCGVIPPLLLFPGPLWPEVVVPIRVPYVGQIDLSENY